MPAQGADDHSERCFLSGILWAQEVTTDMTLYHVVMPHLHVREGCLGADLLNAEAFYALQAALRGLSRAFLVCDEF